jgi:outer membrane lipoprotein LolB
VTRLFGWRLPVRGLADWIDGRPDPSRPARVERDGDRITRIDQDGWTIRIAEIFPASSRPRLLLMDRPPSAGDPAVSVRLVVDDPAS